jgi:DNA-binding response OmpR family regulator
LVIEDEAPVAMALQDRLPRMGYSICDSDLSRRRAAETTERYKPHIILSEINLVGDMDGIDVITKRRSITKAPAIFISAYPSDMVMEHLTRTKRDEYTVKPSRENTLRNALDSVLGLT